MDTISFMRRLGTMILLVLLQVLFLNRIVLFGYAMPLFYIWMIARFENSMSRNSILVWSFVLGLLIDIFSSTPGLNAASATLLGMMQPVILNMFVTMDRHDVITPSSSVMGSRPFTGYLLMLIILHHTVYFILRSIPLGDWTVLILKVLFSSFLTFIIMYVAEYIKANSVKH